jgi:ankyrin repeat protein
MESRCAALVEELLMQISEPSQRKKFVTEMNNMPWRYLDWNDVMDDRDQQNRETTLVYSDSEAAMRNSLDEYSHESLSWTFISCPTTNSHMTKRIAIGEGDNNVRMIRMFDLSQTGDAHNDRLGEFNVVESSDNSEANKTSDAVFDAPDEHYAIAHDDEKLMKWIFDLKKAGGEDVCDIIQAQDAKGKNLYHQCANADSPSILKYFGTLLSKARLLAILQAEDENGDTPIHLSTLHKSAAAMHQLLSPLNRTRLDQLLKRNNKKQQTALEMVQNDINNTEIKPLIECKFSKPYFRWLMGHISLVIQPTELGEFLGPSTIIYIDINLSTIYCESVLTRTSLIQIVSSPVIPILLVSRRRLKP